MRAENPGHYLGTEIEGAWWRRYRAEGFLARGNGTFWFGEQGLHFLRYLTSEPLFIRYDEVDMISTGTWHAGRWNLGRPIVKVHWVRDGVELVSGFVVAVEQSEVEWFVDELSRRSTS